MRRSSNRVIVVLALAVLAAALPAFAEETGEIDWLADLAPAVKQASASDRPILVDVWAIWCAPCKLMDDTTYRDERMVELATRMVPLKIDIDSREAFKLRYNIEAYPTVLFLDGKGGEITREPGFATADELVALTSRVLDGYPDYLAARERVDDPAAVDVVVDYLMRLENPFGAAEHLRKVLKRIKKAGAPKDREAIDVRLAEAQLAAGNPRTASKSFARLSEEAVEPEVRGRALVGLVRAERERGHGETAAVALERLRQEFPALVASATD